MTTLRSTDKLQVKLAAAPTTQLRALADYRDVKDTTTQTYVLGNSDVETNGTTAVDWVPSPAAAVGRTLQSAMVPNINSHSVTVTVQIVKTSGTYTVVPGWLLSPGDSLAYSQDAGWHVVSASGFIKTSGETGADGLNGALTVSTAEIDFGTKPVWEKSFTVVDAAISTSSRIVAVQSGAAATGRDSDENEFDWLAINCQPGTGQFTLRARGLAGPVSGKFKINYQHST